MRKKARPKQLFVSLLGIYYLALILGAMNIGAVGSALKLLGLLPVALWFVRKHSITKDRIVLAALLFAGACVVSIISSINPSASVTRSVTQISFMLMVMAVSSYTFSEDECTFLKHCLIWSSRLTAIFTLIFGQYYQGRIYLNGVVNEDPNYLCTYFLFAIIFAIEICFNSSEKLGRKVLAVGEIAVYMLIIISTGSRGGALAVGASMLIAAALFLHGKGLSRKKLASFLIIPVAAYVGFYLITSFVSSSILDRYSLKTILASGGTGRYQIWEDAIRTYKGANIVKQLIGFGTGTALNVAQTHNFRYVNVIHNIFLENLVEIGIVGFLAYVYMIFCIVMRAYRVDKMYAFPILLGFIIMSLSTSLGAFKPYWNVILYICATGKLKYTDTQRYNGDGQNDIGNHPGLQLPNYD